MHYKNNKMLWRLSPDALHGVALLLHKHGIADMPHTSDLNEQGAS